MKQKNDAVDCILFYSMDSSCFEGSGRFVDSLTVSFNISVATENSSLFLIQEYNIYNIYILSLWKKSVDLSYKLDFIWHQIRQKVTCSEVDEAQGAARFLRIDSHVWP